MILSFKPTSWPLLLLVTVMTLSGLFVFYERPAETAPDLSQVVPEPQTPPLALVGVRDIAPPGAPAQVAPLPPLRRTYTPDCGATAASTQNLAPHNLLRWAFEPDLGFPTEGYDLYRCCGVEAAPPPGDPGWTKLNKDRIRPPQTHAEGQVFVSGIGLLPDGTRNVIGPRITATEWTTYCNVLEQTTGLPSDCPPPPPPGAVDPTAQTFEVSQDPASFLLLASMKPEIATLLGLYWVDDKLESPSCIYRVVGHWSGGIAHESVTGPLIEAPLSPPNGLAAEQTPQPGSFSCEALGGPTQAAGNPNVAMNLTWNLPVVQSMVAAADSPIMYNVCREAPGDGNLVQISRATYDDGTGPQLVESPMIVPRVPSFDGQGNPLLTPSGDPLMVLPDVFYTDHLDDDPLAIGAYTYAITGLDIFGRESLPSPPVQLPLIDPIGPPSPVNVKAQTVQPPTSLTADVELSFDWTAMEAEAAPDAAAFKVFRRVDTPDLTMNGQCPIMPQDDPANWELVATIPVGAYAHLYNSYNPLPVDEQPALNPVLPVQRYALTDTLTLPAGPPVRHFFYRVVAYDAPSQNPGPPSGAVNGHVVDMAPAVPPDDVTPIYSYSEWDSSVQVHLLWSAGATTGSDPMGYKVMRSLRALACATSSQCPKDCDQDGCVPTPCHPSGFCGDGPDLGPTGHRQEDREAMLTNGVEPYNATGSLEVLGKLRALAVLGNLFYRDPATGARVNVAPSCATGDQSACSAELATAIDGRTQYHQDTIPADASGQVFFYRVMAVSRAGLQESEDTVASTVSAPFSIQAPDFIAPTRPELVGAIADGVTGGAVSIQWAVGPESDTLVAGAGYTVERADVGWARCENQRAVCCELTSGTGSTFHWLERGACASQGGQRLDTPATVQVFKEITNTGVILTINDPADAAATSEVIIANELGGFCVPEVPVCCELPASPYPDYLMSDAAMCNTLGGSPWKPLTVGNSGTYTLDDLAPGRCYRVDVVPAGLKPDPSRVIQTAYLLGGAPGTITWRPPGDLNQVALIVRHDALSTVNTSTLIRPNPTPQVIDGYDVVTLNPGAPDERLSLRDTPPIDAHDYCYALKVSDAAGNTSPYSVPLVGRSVDMTPPAPPTNLAVARDSGVATLSWGHDESPVRVRVKRSTAGPNGPWVTLDKAAVAIEVGDGSITALPPENFEHWIDGAGYGYRYRDMSAELGREYWYRVQIYDATGLKSGRDDGKVLLGASD